MKTLFVVLAVALSGAAQTPVPTPDPPPDPRFSETIVVSAIRAEEQTPVTKTDLLRAEIEKSYHGQDVPLLLRDTPSINAYAESGSGGAGYSYISLRGVAPTRINFTLDGVPLSDSEDMGTYFVDFPDLARSLESIQIQRGVGTSTFGTAAFGGSVNMESIALSAQPAVEATVGGGSFGNQQVSAAYHSGRLPGDFAFYTRLSFLESDGYRDNSATRQHNVFVSASKPEGEALLRLTGFSGHENQQLSFYATDALTLETDPRSNPLRPEEKDSFGYDLAQLQYIRPLASNSDMTASVYYQRGYGWYRLFDYGTDVLRQYGLDGMLLGSMLTYARTSGPLTLNTGVHVNRFRRDHTRDDLSLDTRDYANYGVKGEANAFAKLSYDTGRWHLYGDAQVRHSSFDYHGDVAIPSVSWTFFNPKVGARYALTARSSVYASTGLTTREPTRNDLFLGEDNATIAHDLNAVRPERLTDFEAGWTWSGPRLNVTANAYAMEFRHEIAATGELSDIGLALRRNVDRSFRRGLELDATWKATPTLRLKTSANLSRNRIREWTQYVEGQALVFRNVEPLLTPSVIVNQGIDYTPNARLSVGAVGRWIGRSYLDNTNVLEAPSYFTADANVSYAVTSWARVSVQVNNALGNDRIRPNGYSYLYFADEKLTGDAYYYPQATRNALVLLDLKF
ncbi:MAG: TonB-dependent receptor [Acidobacteriota bacterium]